MEGKRHGKQTFSESIRLQFDWNSSGKMLVYCVVVGCLAGFLAAGVYGGLQFFQGTVKAIYPAIGINLPAPDDYTATSGPLPGSTFNDAPYRDDYGFIVLPRYWILILLIPALGGLFCGFIVWTFAPEASGEGADHVIRTYHFRNGTLRDRVSLTKILTSFLTLGTGGSGGLEGPTCLFGAGIASAIAKGLQLTVRDRRTLLLAGVAGAVGGIFQIPVGGAFYAVEILYASTALEFSAILPCILASVVGFSTFRFVHGDVRPIELPATFGIHNGFNSFLLICFIPIIAFAGLVFVRIIMDARNKFFRRLPIPELFKPALGGFLLGCIALVFPQVLGGGYEWIPHLVENKLPFYLILILIVPKMIATACTVSSGGSGGLFAPSILIGGLIGGTLGHLSQIVFTFLGVPHWSPDISTSVLVGMSAFFGGIGKLPFAAAIIVCELAGFHYTFLIPLIILNLLHIAIQSPSTSIYEEQVLAPIDSEAHFGNYSIDLLQILKVQDAFSKENGVTVLSTSSIPDTIKLIAPLPDTLFPVLDDQGKFVGVLYATDVWGAFQHRNQWKDKTVWDLMRQTPTTISPRGNLYNAMRICILEGVSEIPVIDPKQPDILLGTLRHSDIITAYNERLAAAQWT